MRVFERPYPFGDWVLRAGVEVDAAVAGGDHDQNVRLAGGSEGSVHAGDRLVQGPERRVDDPGSVRGRIPDPCYGRRVAELAVAHDLDREDVGLRRDSDIATVVGRSGDDGSDERPMADRVPGIGVAVVEVPARDQIGTQILAVAVDARVDDGHGYSRTARRAPDGQHVEAGNGGAVEVGP